MSNTDLQALFASIRTKSQTPSAAATPSQATENLFTMPSTPQVPPSQASFPHAYTDSTRNDDVRGPGNSATAQNLLNLLNFGSSRGTQPEARKALNNQSENNNLSTQQDTSRVTMSASDLVARFMSPSIESSHRDVGTNDIVGEDTKSASNHAPVNPLLELLNRQSSAAPSPATEVEAAPARSVSQTHQQHDDIVKRTDSPIRIFGTSASRENTPFEAPPVASSPPSQETPRPIFTYKNPFEALKASRSQTPKGAIQTTSVPKPESDGRDSHIESEELERDKPTFLSARRILTPKLLSSKSSESPLATSAPDPISTSPVLETATSSHVASKLPSSREPNTTTLLDAGLDSATQAETLHQSIEKTEVGEKADKNANPSAGEWEDVDETPSGPHASRVVPVLNFPIKAFVSISLNLEPSTETQVRDDGVMQISRLKKEFDQVDRSLAAATTKYITYAFVKNGGMRIIRQADGSDRHIFKNSYDRIFNVAFCTSATNLPASDDQAILGTGVSGAVYYAAVSKEGNDIFQKNELESESLVFPAFPQADENTAGGALKTRAKRSSRHPEFFAIGRGKSIQIVWPSIAMSSKYGIDESNRQVDVEKLFQERALQISTGKAGKDFNFSEDDTMIVSLDKTGRLRFWDIRKLVDEANTKSPRPTPIIVDTPMLSLSTASPAEKSWPTSVLFVDKARPYNKGGASRYVLVGLRQNHTLQLWDIALGKAVQEINFPHDNETDGICSVNYHPGSSIIVVSHPTRNSIFFIHLSVPRYTLSSSLSQASYVERVGLKDPEIPKPDSTACMSGIREISFSNYGQLRSVELLSCHKSSGAKAIADDNQALFELYVVHSKGVTCLSITRDDLGWNADNKVINSIDAAKEGLLTLKDLKLGSVIEETTSSKSPVGETLPQTKASKKKSKKASKDVPEEPIHGSEEVNTNVAVDLPVAQSAQPNKEVDTGEAPIVIMKEGKKKKKATQNNEQIRNVSPIKPEDTQPIPQTNGKTNGGSDYTMPTPQPAPPAHERLSQPESVPTGISGDKLGAELRKIETGVSTEFKKEFDVLFQNIQKDRAAQEQSSAIRQEAILRLVSESLNTNVEQTLSKILATQLQETVVPTVIESISMRTGTAVTKSLEEILPKQIGGQLSTTVIAGLQNPQIARSIADQVFNRLSKQIETQIAETITKVAMPAFKNMTITATENVATDIEARIGAQLRELQQQQAADNAKLDRFGLVLEGMAATLETMSNAQLAFQSQISKDRRLTPIDGTGLSTATSQLSTARLTPSPKALAVTVPVRPKTKAEIEFDEITGLMNEGKYEEGSVRWLQSDQPIKLFDDLFVRFTPEYLATDVSPLVAFSIAVTLGTSLETNTGRRLEWIAAALAAVDLKDKEISDISQHAPTLINSLIQKLESLYMTRAELDPTDPLLKAIFRIVKIAKDMKLAFQTMSGRVNASPYSRTNMS